MRYWFICILLSIVPGVAVAGDNCPAPMLQINQDVKGKINGDLSTLIKIGKVSGSGDITTVTNELLSKYPNADKLAMEQNILSILCNKVLSNDAVSQEFKEKVIERLLDKLSSEDKGKTELKPSAAPNLSVSALINENSFCEQADISGDKCKNPLGTAFTIVIDNDGGEVGKDVTVNTSLGGIDRINKDLIQHAMQSGEFAPLNAWGFVSPASDVQNSFLSNTLAYQFKIPIISPQQRALYRIWRAGNRLSFFDVSISSEYASFSKRVICDAYSVECKPKEILLYP